MITYIVIGFLALGVLYLIGLLVIAKRENQQLREDLSRTVPFRESRFAEPHVPSQWKPAAADLDDPNSRNTPPHDPAP